MRECSVTLDLLAQGKLRSGLNMLAAGDRICNMFGGYTARVGFGCWRGTRTLDLEFDMSVTFWCACQPGDWPAFRDLALVLAEGQETVYLTGPQGEAFILPVGSGVVDVVPKPVPDEAPFALYNELKRRSGWLDL